MHQHILDWVVKIYSSYLVETDDYNDHLTRTNKQNQETILFEQKIREMALKRLEGMKGVGADKY